MNKKYCELLILEAEFYLTKGLKLVPLQFHEKRCIMQDWPKRYAKKLVTVQDWLENGFPQDNEGSKRLPLGGIGIVTGASSGIIVLDVDGDIGQQSLETLLQSSGMTALPETPVQHTPGKIKDGKHLGRGKHYFFRLSHALPGNTNILPGIDVKADGGYVVASPSYHPDHPIIAAGQYQWDLEQNFELVDLADFPPQFLATLQKEKKQKTPATAPGTTIEDHTRNNTLFNLAIRLRQTGLISGQEVEDVVRVVNKKRCPIPLEENELRTLLKSSASYVPETDGGPQAGVESLAWQFDNSVRITNVDMVGGLFPRGYMSLVASSPGIGKSWFLQRFATDISNGGDIFGGIATSEPLKTLFFSGESGRDSLIRRGQAMKWEPRQENFLIVDAVNAAEKGVSLMLHELKGQANIEALVKKHSPQLIVFDSLLSFHTLDESNFEGMIGVLMWLLRLARSRNIAVLLSHHERKCKKVEARTPSSQNDIIGTSAFTRLVACSYKLEAINPMSLS